MSGYKIKKQITISIVASIFLAQQSLYALPSGGKFTHGNGTITNNNGKGNNMTIKGDIREGNNNFVIGWGGGFNIEKGQKVEFANQDGKQNYLNIDYQKKASSINGTLEGYDNNIFLINPSGVLVGKGGRVNANKFVAANTRLNETMIKDFISKGGSFSPVFDISKSGNIVNQGYIRANEIVLIGNKVENAKGGVLAGKDSTDISLNQANKIHLVGNYVYVNVGSKNSDGNTMEGGSTISVGSGGDNGFFGTAVKQGYLQTDMTSFAENKYQFFNGAGNIVHTKYGNINSSGSGNFDRAVTIGGYTDFWGNLDDNENAKEWGLFVSGWNSNSLNADIFKDGLTTIRLISNIDFKGKAYDPVGANKYAFSGIFDGGGYTLKNIKINAQDNSNWYTGLFGRVEGKDVAHKAKIYNLTVDGLRFSGITNSGGGFVAQSKNAEFSGIKLKNYGKLEFKDTHKNEDIFAGGFVGKALGGSSFSNISMENFDGITLKPIGDYSSAWINSFLGGFAGYSEGGVTFNNISLSNLGEIYLGVKQTGGGIYAGGFIGYANGDSAFQNITLQNVGRNAEGEDKGIIAEAINEGTSYVKNAGSGGFIGAMKGERLKFNNISLIDSGSIKAIRAQMWQDNGGFYAGAGGFAGLIEAYDSWSCKGGCSTGKIWKDFDGIFSNIYMNYSKDMEIFARRHYQFADWEMGYAGGFIGGIEDTSDANGVVLKNFVINGVYMRLGSTNNNTGVKIYVDYDRNGKRPIKGYFIGGISGYNIDTITNVTLYATNKYHDSNAYYTDYSWPAFFVDGKNRYIFLDNTYWNGKLVNWSDKQANLDLINKVGGATSSDVNNGYLSFYDEKVPPNPSIPDVSVPNPKENDFAKDEITKILNELLNGKYTIDLGSNPYEIKLSYTDANGESKTTAINLNNLDGVDENLKQTIEFLVAFQGQGDFYKMFSQSAKVDKLLAEIKSGNLQNYINKIAREDIVKKLGDNKEALKILEGLINDNYNGNWAELYMDIDAYNKYAKIANDYANLAKNAEVKYNAWQKAPEGIIKEIAKREYEKANKSYNEFAKANGAEIDTIKNNLDGFKNFEKTLGEFQTAIADVKGSYDEVEGILGGLLTNDESYKFGDNGSGSFTFIAQRDTTDKNVEYASSDFNMKGWKEPSTPIDPTDPVEPPTDPTEPEQPDVTPELPDIPEGAEVKLQLLTKYEKDPELEVEKDIEEAEGQEGSSLCIVNEGFVTHNVCSAQRI